MTVIAHDYQYIAIYSISLTMFLYLQLLIPMGRGNHPKWIANNIITNKTHSKDKFGFVSEREEGREREREGIKT